MSEKKAEYKVMGRSKYDFDFERIDLRRSWLVLGAIQNTEKPTVTSIAKVLDFSKSTVQRIIENLNSPQYPCLEIKLNGAICSVENWGVINSEIIENLFSEYLQVLSERTIIKA